MRLDQQQQVQIMANGGTNEVLYGYHLSMPGQPGYPQPVYGQPYVYDPMAVQPIGQPISGAYQQGYFG